ncbi:N-acetylglucosamine-6-phosphate deacetylase [Microlunatus parietis]|uniref:N-acetylglucosamine-6-phosphate deacetylase n=1 Tax=Microlunatus parietis TaxID=682979 RepID=A0A7Y9LD63_9ACTN|nr:N-acetylglucosamine-6-phosphate deacetylase [Microlunatus parietis]NYE73562.1 N-acetylglucosamine-6-phosphate deacetylase [Microlunatus parietis]
MTETVLHCERVVTPDGVRTDALIKITDGVITELGPSTGSGERVEGWVLPGYVDTHVHGGGGGDYPTTDPDEALKARDFHARNGTTTSYASLVSAEPDLLVRQIKTLVPLVDAGAFAGIHLEGPFLSAAKCGAHDPALLTPPTPELLDRLLKAGAGRIAMITLAPELDHGPAAIERLTRAGVRVAFGHSDSDARLTATAIDAGATVATHLFNAMRPIHHREPGPVPRLLDAQRVTVELICDGIHLHPDVITMAIAAAGPDRVALITDAMSAAGLADGSYALGHLDVTVAGGAVHLVNPDGSAGSIAGSTLTMAGAVEFVVGLGVPIPEAARMAATTPARAHGLDRVGELMVGRAADLCVVDDQGRLQRVLRAGDWLETE